MLHLRYLVIAAVLAGAVPSVAGDLKDPKATFENPEPRVIPKAWGRLVSVTAEAGGTMLYFEATDGTIRRASAIQLGGVLVERGIWFRK